MCCAAVASAVDGLARRLVHGDAGRVADEVEAIPAAGVGLPDDAGHLCVEAVVRRRSVAGVELEILGDGLDLVAERFDQRTVGEVGGKDAARHEDHAMDGSSFRASTSSMKASTTGCAGSMA